LWTTSFIIGCSEYVHTSAYVLCYEHVIKNKKQGVDHLLSPAHPQTEKKHSPDNPWEHDEDKENYLAKARHQ